MGFRFFKLNPIRKSYLSRISSPEPHKTWINSSHSSRFLIQGTAIQSASRISSVGDDFSNFRIFKRWHMGHSHDHLGHHFHGPPRDSSKESENVFWLGLGADIGLSAGKALTGYLSGSTAIIADAAHSLSDVVLSGIALASFKAARVPKDKDHPYGHGKFETLGAMGISCMLLLTGGGIAWHAIDLLLGLYAVVPDAISQPLAHDLGHHQSGHSHKIDMDHPILALNMTILSIAIKEGLFWITRRAGEREGSGLMKANAWHHRADAISSVIALIGVGGSILGMKFLDPLAGLLVSGMILKAGVESGYQSIMELVDAAIPQQELEPYHHTILQIDGVKGCHRLRGRRAGSFLYLDVHIEVDPFTSVSAAHHVGEIVRRQLHKSHLEVAEVFIHIDPSLSEIYPDISQHRGELRGADKLIRDDRIEHKDIDGIILNIFSSKFSERMVVEHVTRHFIQENILLQIEVSMPPDVMLRDAMEMAEKAKEDILRTISNVVQVSVLLRLGQPDHKPS